MTELEFARQIFYCVENGIRGGFDLLTRCRQWVATLEAAEKVEEEKAKKKEVEEEKASLGRRVDALVARVLDLESARERHETYEAEQRERGD